MPVLWLQYFPLYHRVNIGPVLSICESRDSMQTKARISLLCYFVAHVISTQHQRAGRPPHPHTDIERVCYQRNKGQCGVLSHFQHTAQDKGAGNKPTLCSPKTRRRCCCAVGCDVIVMVHPLRDLGDNDPRIATSEGERNIAVLISLYFRGHASSPSHKREYACIHPTSQI